ncbi:phospholipase A2 [uncultured Pseudonocardia sp.]|uniref:phospholipase A2 n=1 Tax=uncultured Pseudonocardia sp. TaxID=211455 RepID=UPI002620DE1A|nr:phospholipase A2 [uncultured Pseudonocardia sp.]
MTSRLVSTLLWVAVLLGVAVAVAPAASASPTSDEAVRIMNLDYKSFITYKNKVDKVSQFNWTSDGCSSRWYTAPVHPVYRNLFNRPCQQHDFGYRNFGTHEHGLALSPTEDTRAWIDARFITEMNRLCDTNFRSWWQTYNKIACKGEASSMYAAVRNGGRGSFYA